MPTERSETTVRHCGHVACLGMSYCTLTLSAPVPDERQAGLREALADRLMEAQRLNREAIRITERTEAVLFAEWLLEGLALAQVPAQPHTLLWPPHPGDVYLSSALCSCGEWQYDADNASELFNDTRAVLSDWTQHVAQVPAKEERPPQWRMCSDCGHAEGLHYGPCSFFVTYSPPTTCKCEHRAMSNPRDIPGYFSKLPFPDERQAGLRAPYGGHPEFGPRFVANTTSPSLAGWEALARDALAAFDECRAALAAQDPAQEERLDVERLARALQAATHSTEVRSLYGGDKLLWAELGEANRQTKRRDAERIAAEYRALGVESKEEGL